MLTSGLQKMVKFGLIRLGNKNALPLRIFQNGQILFPAGPGDEKNLWFGVLLQRV